MDVKQFENLALRPLLLMEESLKNMLKQANIIESEIEISGDKFTAIFK